MSKSNTYENDLLALYHDLMESCESASANQDDESLFRKVYALLNADASPEHVEYIVKRVLPSEPSAHVNSRGGSDRKRRIREYLARYMVPPSRVHDDDGVDDDGQSQDGSTALNNDSRYETDTTPYGRVVLGGMLDGVITDVQFVSGRVVAMLDVVDGSIGPGLVEGALWEVFPALKARLRLVRQPTAGEVEYHAYIPDLAR
jgi:hypothetical protein